MKLILLIGLVLLVSCQVESQEDILPVIPDWAENGDILNENMTELVCRNFSEGCVLNKGGRFWIVRK